MESLHRPQSLYTELGPYPYAACKVYSCLLWSTRKRERLEKCQEDHRFWPQHNRDNDHSLQPPCTVAHGLNGACMWTHCLSHLSSDPSHPLQHRPIIIIHRCPSVIGPYQHSICMRKQLKINELHNYHPGFCAEDFHEFVLATRCQCPNSTEIG